MRIVLHALLLVSLGLFSAPNRAVAQGNVSDLQKQAEKAEAERQAAEKQLAELRKQFKGVLENLKKVKSGRSAAERKIKAAEPTLKKQQAAVKSATDANQKAAAALAAAQKALAAAQKAAADAKQKADAAAKALQTAQANEKKTQTEVASAKATLSKSADDLKKAEGDVNALQAKVMAKKAELAKLDQQAIARQKATEAALAKQGKFVSFSDEVAPIFASRCLACHNARTAKGRLNMESFQSIMKGGESGAVIDKKDPGFSTLLIMVEDGSMPKDADPLTKPQIATIKKWLENGAKLNAGISPSANLATIIPKAKQPEPPKSYRVPMPVTAVAFSPDGKTLATSGYHEVILWDPATGKILRRLTNVAERIKDLEFSGDGKTLAVAAGTPGQLGEAKLFNVADGKLLGDFVTTNDTVNAVAISPDGKMLATAGNDRAIRVFDIATGKQLVQIEDHADWVMGIAWSPDGKKLASASRDKTSKVFDMTERKPDLNAIALGIESKNVLSGESLATFNSHGEPVHDVGFSPDGKSVITAGADKQIRVWNPANGKQVRAIGGFGDKVFDIEVAKDGRVFSSSADKTARVHTYANGKAVKTYSGNADWVYSVAHNPAGKQVATGSYNGEVRIFNAADGKQVRQFVAAPGHAK